MSISTLCPSRTRLRPTYLIEQRRRVAIFHCRPSPQTPEVGVGGGGRGAGRGQESKALKVRTCMRTEEGCSMGLLKHLRR